jgi:hypothetical protein
MPDKYDHRILINMCSDSLRCPELIKKEPPMPSQRLTTHASNAKEALEDCIYIQNSVNVPKFKTMVVRDHRRIQ